MYDSLVWEKSIQGEQSCFMGKHQTLLLKKTTRKPKQTDQQTEKYTEKSKKTKLQII